jgi:hypothetical protein
MTFAITRYIFFVTADVTLPMTMHDHNVKAFEVANLFLDLADARHAD